MRPAPALATACLLLLACPGLIGEPDAGPAGGGQGGGLGGGGGGTGGGGTGGGGTGGGGTGGGGGGGVGGGAGGGGAGGGLGAGVDAGLFQVSWVDDGGVLVGCEVAALREAAPPECAPAVAGCQVPADCPSGLCLRLASGGVCTQACSGATCPAGWRCQQRWTGRGQEGYCVPTRRTP